MLQQTGSNIGLSGAHVDNGPTSTLLYIHALICKVALLPACVESYESDLVSVGDLQASDLCDRAGRHHKIAVERAGNRESWDFADPLTSAWRWCDSSDSCSLLQSFSCETLKHCLRHSKEDSVPHNAFFNRQSSQGAELSDLAESTQEVTHLGIKYRLWSSAFQHSFQFVSCFEKKYPSHSHFFGHHVSAGRHETRFWPTKQKSWWPPIPNLMAQHGSQHFYRPTPKAAVLERCLWRWGALLWFLEPLEAQETNGNPNTAPLYSNHSKWVVLRQQQEVHPKVQILFYQNVCCKDCKLVNLVPCRLAGGKHYTEAAQPFIYLQNNWRLLTS